MPVTETPAQVLDCKGLQCPLPVIKTAQAIKTLEPGQVLELLATDPGVEPDEGVEFPDGERAAGHRPGG